MANVSHAQASTALKLLADAAVDRRSQLQQFGDDSDPFDPDGKMIRIPQFLIAFMSKGVPRQFSR